MTEVVVDQKQAPLPPPDPNVKIPDAVKRRAAEVDALYNRNGQNGPAPEPAHPSPTAPPSQAPEPSPAPEPQADSEAPSPPPAEPSPPVDDSTSDWETRFKGLSKRYREAQNKIKGMEGQMEQMGELLRTPPPQQAPRPPQPPPSYLTQQDVQNYGTDLIDFTQRAAAQYVAPHLQRVEQENERLRQQMAEQDRKVMHERIEAAIPNWREINNDPRWHQWLALPDMYSGRIRQELLSEATATANASRVISFFNGFLAEEERATGQAPPSHPREPAVPMAYLAAPGRARPASGGDTSIPPDKPFYTRPQIAELYAQHRRGYFTGREAEWSRIEADIFAAGREGRIRNPLNPGAA